MRMPRCWLGMRGLLPAPMRNGAFIQKRLTLTSADGVSDLKLSNHVSVVVHD